jgi:hypothetical protein
MVTIIVGKGEGKQWILPERLLCDKVPYFAAEFRGDFIEGNKRVIRLVDDNPDIFALLVKWLLGWALPYPERGFDAETSESIFKWFQLYVLADKLGVGDLCSEVIDPIDERSKLINQLPSPDLVVFTYENTVDASPLRETLIKITLRLLIDGILGAPDVIFLGSSNKVFLEDIVVTLIERFI